MHNITLLLLIVGMFMFFVTITVLIHHDQKRFNENLKEIDRLLKSRKRMHAFAGSPDSWYADEEEDPFKPRKG